jgi:hypothetical protein
MIVDTPQAFAQAISQLDLPADSAACPQGVFLVEPSHFFVSSESAADNHYMNLTDAADAKRALRQFHQLVQLIRDCGIEAEVFPGNADTPDDVFPNNVFGTIPGRLIIGSMHHPQRRKEAERLDIPEFFRRRAYSISDLRMQNCVAELTGPLIIDRARKIGFCGMSERVDTAGAAAMLEAFALRLMLCFDLVPEEYHTNVVMSVLAGRACVLHPEALVDPAMCGAIASAFPDRTLFLDKAEKDHFAGNCIALSESDLFMSQCGADALRPKSRATLESWGFRLRTVNLDEIEKAGGSLRCMVAEIF